MIFVPLLCLFIATIFKSKSKLISGLGIGGFILSSLYIIYFRYGFGADYFAYKTVYETVSKTDIKAALIEYNMETGFLYLVMIFKRLKLSYNAFTLIINTTTLTFFVLWIKDNTKKKFTIESIFIFFAMFFLVWVTSAYRQGLVAAIALYFLYNPRFEKWGIIPRILTIFALSFIHQSILILLVYMILGRFFIDKKRLLLGIVMALVLTLLPIDKLLNPFTTFYAVKKVIGYINTGTFGFWDFQGLIRLGFFALFLLQYNQFMEESEPIKRLYFFNLIGFIIYFCLKFSEITAARSTIYSFMAVPILLPYSIEYLIDAWGSKIKIPIKIYKSIAFVLITIFCGLFYLKELRAMNEQTGYTKSMISMTIPTQSNTSPLEFKTYFALKEYLRIEADKDFEQYLINQTFTKYTYESGDYFTNAFVKENNRFGVINNQGILIDDPVFIYEPEVYGEFFSYIDVSNRYGAMYFKNINPNFEGSKLDEVSKIMDKKIKVDIQQVYVYNPDRIDDPRFVKAINVLEDLNITDYEIVDMAILNHPLTYSVVQVKVYDQQVFYIYLNEDGDIIYNRLFENFSRYDVNGFIKIATGNKLLVFNKEGDLIWVQDR